MNFGEEVEKAEVTEKVNKDDTVPMNTPLDILAIIELNF